MSDTRKMSQTYYDKADEARAFADYAPFRYGQVAMDPEAARRIKELRAGWIRSSSTLSTGAWTPP